MTIRQRQVLTKMRDEDKELVYFHGRAYVAYERISAATMLGLLCAMAIRLDSFSEFGRFERYTITQTGRELLEKLP